MEQYAPVCTEFKAYNMSYDNHGNPLISDCQKHMFPQYYLTPESMSLFENLYYGDLQSKFLSFWKAVA